NRKPDFLVGSSILLMPTSITTAPSLTISAVRYKGRPRATTIISEVSVCFLISGVLLWQRITVASPGVDFRDSRILIGVPTILLRPITQQVFPAVSIL